MFKEVLFESKAVRRFMELERLDEDGIIELYFDCFCSYMETMKERIKCGRDLSRIISAYKDIQAFRQASPQHLFTTLHKAPDMHRWFACLFRAEIDKQVINNNTDKDELWVSLTFTRAIPTAKLMEGILNERTGKGNRTGAIPAVGKTEAGEETRRVKHPDKQSV